MPINKFTPERRAAIIASVKDCMPLHIAANENDIHQDTLTKWMRRGSDDLRNEEDTEHAVFFCSIKKAIGQVMRDLTKTVRACRDGWQGSAWMLERRWWKDWSHKVADLDFNERLEKLESKEEQNVVSQKD